jgi:microcompartment protein CcmL/EutN
VIATKTALGLVEFSNIAQGIAATDIMVKAAPVELVQSLSLCPGKFVTLVAGSTSAVKTSVTAGTGCMPTCTIDSLILPNVHPGVIPALAGATRLVLDGQALGIIETFSVAAALRAADTAAKKGQVVLGDIRLARGMGGKALVLIIGNVSAVQAAVQAGEESVSDGFLVSTALLTAPAQALLEKVL